MIDREVSLVGVAVIALIGIFTASQVSQLFVAGSTSESFSTLAILGPNQKLSDYPKNVKAGENFTLYLYVENQETRVMYFRVYVKLGDRSSIVNSSIPPNVLPMAQYDTVLARNQTWLEPINLRIDTPAVNYRLVFELWVYNPNQGNFTYYGRMNQLWLNVTSSS